VASVAASTPAPGGGSVAAHAGALAAALAQMVAGLTVGKKKFAAVESDMKALALEASSLGTTLAGLVRRDGDAYTAVMAAYQLPKETPDQQGARQAAVDGALLAAARVPLETAQACAEVARLAAVAAEKGNPNAASDAGVAALLAEAACKGAAYNVRINVAALSDPSRGAALVDSVMQALAATSERAAAASRAVEAAIG
jgi:glutamate formiminotransferase/formiminotetrahydrofolate cyclodeaminase